MKNSKKVEIEIKNKSIVMLGKCSLKLDEFIKKITLKIDNKIILQIVEI